jgi:PGF-pre-PGF domain-containing protein
LETDFNQTQAVTISGLSASTQYFYNVSICDYNGNCAKNGTFNFTTNAAAAEAAAAAAGGGGGGGGGGAAAPSNEVASASRRWDSLAAGSSGVLTINNEQIAVTGVIIDVKATLTNAEIKVASLVSNPISAVAAAKVYQYLQLTKSNIADLDASKITINFRVPKSWLTSNNVAEDNVVLYRYSDNKWNALPTSKTGSDANNVLYQSTTPGFSTFAIGTKEAAPVVAPTPEAPVPEVAPPAPTPEAPAAPTVPEAKKPLSRTATAWIVVLVIVVVAAVGYYIWQKKKGEY